MGSQKGSVKTALIIPDCHIPFESSAYDLMIRICKTIPIDEIVILGDYLDLYGLSFYEQNPELGDVAELFDRELECGNHRLDEIDGLWDCKKVFLEGNHEFRMKKFLNKNAPALRNRVKLHHELNLHKRPKWKWVPFTKLQSYPVLGSTLYARHCPPTGGQPTNVAKQSGDSVIYGHTHQIGVATFVSKMSGKVTYAINAGWLGNEREKVFDYVHTRQNWTHSFTLVHTVGKSFWFEQVRIVDGRTNFRGKVFK